MEYIEFLKKNGHLEAFYEHLSSTGSIKKLPVTFHLLYENERTFLGVFGDNVIELHKAISLFYDHLTSQKGKKCQQCGNDFGKDENTICLSCGWNFQIGLIGLESFVVNDSLAIIQKNNKAYLDIKLQELYFRMTLKKLDVEATQWSAAADKIDIELNEIKKETVELTENLEQKVALKKELEHQVEYLETEIKQLDRDLTNTASLFLNFGNHHAQQSLNLFLKGNILGAIVKSDTVFPIDLIVGFQKVDNVNRAGAIKTINKTSCFLFIYEKDWESGGNGRWKVNLSNVAKGRIKGRFYLNFISHLHKKDYLSNIRFEPKIVNFI